jgi:hypothetical protein
MNEKSKIIKTIIIELFDDNTAVIREQDYVSCIEENGLLTNNRFITVKKHIETLLTGLKKV